MAAQNHQARAGSPTTPIFDRYSYGSSISHSFTDDNDDLGSSPTQPLNPASVDNNTGRPLPNNPYRRPAMPPFPAGAPMPSGKRQHPLSKLLTPTSSTPTLASEGGEADVESTYDAKRSSNVHVMQAGSSTPYLGTPSEDEKHFSIPNVTSSNSNGGLLAWLAEDEKRRSGEANEGRSRVGSSAVSGEEGRRVGYIDGLKFLCGLIAMNATFLAITQEEPGVTERISPLYVTRSANIALQGLLLLSGRSLPIPLPHASPLLSLSLISRPLRFVPAVIVIILLQWGICAGGHTQVMTDVLGISPPSWCGIDNAAGFFTLLWGLFGSFSYNTTVGQAFGANLWSVPWFFQSSYFTYLLHIMVSALPSNRYWIYIVLFCFTWSTFSYYVPALLGYVIYDMSTMFLPRVRRMPLVQRLLVQAVLLGLIILFEFINPTRTAINAGMAAWNVRNVTQIQFADTFFVTFVLLWVEITPWAQLLLGNFLVRYLFILTPGFYLLTPTLTYTVVPAVMSHFSNSFNNAGGLFAAWVTLLVTITALSLVFYFLVVYPSTYLSRLLCSFLVSWGPDADPDSFADAGEGPSGTEGKRRVYVEKPFRSFSLVTSAFGTPIGSPAPSVRRMRMDDASIRGSPLNQPYDSRPQSPRIEMTPLASPEGATPHGSTDNLSYGGGRNHSRTPSQDSHGKRPEGYYGQVPQQSPPMAMPSMTQRPSQSPPLGYGAPPPTPPKGARLPSPHMSPYYQG